MDADLALQILVIVLSVVLLISLIISIVAGVLVIKLVKVLKNVAEKGEQLVDTAESTIYNIKQNVGMTGLLRSLTQIIKIVSKLKK